MPPVVPQVHGGSVLRRKLGGGEVIGVEGDMGMDRSTPFWRTATLYRGRCGDPHRIRVLRRESFRSGDKYGVVLDVAGQAGHPFFLGGDAFAPELAEHGPGLMAEAKRGLLSGHRTLGRSRRAPQAQR